MGSPKVNVATSQTIRTLEKRLAVLAAEKEVLADEEKALKAQLTKELKDADMTRSLYWRLSTTSSSGALRAESVARHFGCSVSFLSKFRSRGRRTTSLVKAKPPKTAIFKDV